MQQPQFRKPQTENSEDDSLFTMAECCDLFESTLAITTTFNAKVANLHNNARLNSALSVVRALNTLFDAVTTTRIEEPKDQRELKVTLSFIERQCLSIISMAKTSLEEVIKTQYGTPEAPLIDALNEAADLKIRTTRAARKMSR